jgi:LysR family transcriptional regulator for metE and metH
VRSYIDHDYVIAKRIGAKGLWSELYGIAQRDVAAKPYSQDFIALVREKCAAALDGIQLL